MISDRRHMTDDPPMFAIDLTQTHNEKMREYINGTLIYANIVTGAHEPNNKVSSAAGTKFRTYCNINRDLSVHNDYSTYIPEHLRIAFTRVRLSSHRLRIETGRWARVHDSVVCVNAAPCRTKSTCWLYAHSKRHSGAAMTRQWHFPTL